MKLYEDLNKNINQLETEFSDCGDVVKRKFPVGILKNTSAYIIYIDNMANKEIIEHTVIASLMLEIRESPPDIPIFKPDVFEVLKDGGVPAADIKETENFEDITMAVMSGDTGLLLGDSSKAVIISTRGFPNRGISAAETEVVVQGSKESFSEVIRFNTCLIRRRIKDTKLKVKQTQIGRRTNTDIALMYIEGIVRDKVLKECEKRLKSIDIDGILDSGYIEQLIEDDRFSPFPQGQMTERPDKAAAAILEGRIAIIVDNSPFVLLVPVVLASFFQSSEDYYQRFEIMSFVRILRFIAGITAVCLPALYIAVSVYHPSMLPLFLTLKMAGARQEVPFPAVYEVLLMDIAFELLREAGIRLPGAVGSTIGIVGGLIIGQAAVEAGIVSPVVVIIIALTGIASFAIPSVSLVSGFRIVKYLLIILSAILGLYGFWLGLILCLIHLVSLKSFGIPYVFPFASGEVNDYSDLKDSFIRAPLSAMKKRPIFANPKQAKRFNQSTGKKE